MYGHACNQITTHNYTVGGTQNSSSRPGGNPASILVGDEKSICHEGSMVAGSHHAKPFCVSSNQRVAAGSVAASRYPPGNADTCSTI